jgi:predicted peptidase
MRNPDQTPHVFEGTDTRAIRLKYLLFQPSLELADSSERWPLIIFLHGSGERGSILSKVAAHGPPHLVKKQPQFPFLVASPLCPKGSFWSKEVLLPFLVHLLALYPVDRERVYLTGLSMGGYGVWELALAAPERFAAVAPVCGGGTLLPLLLADRGTARAFKTLGVWAFHGAKDPVVQLEESERMVHAFRHLGNDAKLTIYPDAGHDSWTETYDNPALYSWFLKHRRR